MALAARRHRIRRHPRACRADVRPDPHGRRNRRPDAQPGISADRRHRLGRVQGKRRPSHRPGDDRHRAGRRGVVMGRRRWHEP